MHAGFSERTFEFCFNAEFCLLNAAILATHPHIPTQNAEKDLGYDVEMKIKSGGYVKSLFLQHKVASHAHARAAETPSFSTIIAASTIASRLTTINTISFVTSVKPRAMYPTVRPVSEAVRT